MTNTEHIAKFAINCDAHVNDPSYSIKIAATVTATATTGNACSPSPIATVTKANNINVPALAFGLYKVPNDDEGVRIVLDAITRANYRHLDSASIYGNEKTLGKALANCIKTTTTTASTSSSSSSSSAKQKIIERSKLFVASKVWNDAQKEGRIAVRRSVEQSLKDLGLDYLDICYIHWPVPGYFVDTYRELLLLQKEGKIKFLGISNFRIADYEELLANVPQNEFVPPLINQFEVSPFLYRPKMIKYFQEKEILVAASKALNRAAGLDGDDSIVVRGIAESYSVTPAQVLLRWSFQKGLIVLSKTSSLSRMKENRALFEFSLSREEMEQLDGITTKEVVQARDELEDQRRTS